MIELIILAVLLYFLTKNVNIDNYNEQKEQERENQVANELKNIRMGQTFTLPVYSYIYYPSYDQYHPNQLFGRVLPESGNITATAISDPRETEDGAIEVDVNIDFQGKPPKVGR